MGIPIRAGAGSNNARKTPFPITIITGTSNSGATSYTLDANNSFRIGRDTVYATTENGEPLFYNMNITFDNTAMLENPNFGDPPSGNYPFYISLATPTYTSLPINPNTTLANVSYPDGLGRFPQLTYFNTRGIETSELLAEGGTATFIIPFAERDSGWSAVGQDGVGAKGRLENYALGFPFGNRGSEVTVQISIQDDNGVWCTSTQTIGLGSEVVGEAEPSSSTISIDSLTTTTFSIGDGINPSPVPLAEILTSLMDGGNGFVAPSDTMAELYSPFDPQPINLSFSVTYDSSQLDIEDFSSEEVPVTFTITGEEYGELYYFYDLEFNQIEESRTVSFSVPRDEVVNGGTVNLGFSTFTTDRAFRVRFTGPEAVTFGVSLTLEKENGNTIETPFRTISFTPTPPTVKDYLNT